MREFRSLFLRLFDESSHESASEIYGVSSNNSHEQRAILLWSFIKLKKIRDVSSLGSTQNFATHWTAVPQRSRNFLSATDTNKLLCNLQVIYL